MHKQEKNQFIKTDLEMTEEMETADKDAKTPAYKYVPYAQGFKGKH